MAFFNYLSGRNKINSSSSRYLKAHRISFRHDERALRPSFMASRVFEIRYPVKLYAWERMRISEETEA